MYRVRDLIEFYTPNMQLFKNIFIVSKKTFPVFLDHHETSRVLDGRLVCGPRGHLSCNQLDFIR